jgi:hypothetical protein
MTYAEEVYKILVEECGAPPRQYDDFGFAYHWPDCGEWRFQGNQGFGGKVYAGYRDTPAYVQCYQEDDNPERKAARERANARLAQLTKENNG